MGGGLLFYSSTFIPFFFSLRDGCGNIRTLPTTTLCSGSLLQALSGAHRAAGVWHGPDPQERMLSYRQRDTARKRMFAVNSLWEKKGMPAEVVELMQIYSSHGSFFYISFC